MLDDTEIRINVIKYKNGMVTSATESIDINQWKNEGASRGALAAAVIDSLLRRAVGGRETND